VAFHGAGPDKIDIWGDGKQTRSFLDIDECREGIRRFMEADFAGPSNIGSEEMVTIDQMAGMVMQIAGKQRGPQGGLYKILRCSGDDCG
jgi:nucleoside-diphosphate-sugar epimerase